MITVDAILAVKGVAPFAESIGVRVGTVRVWKTRQTIPRRYWPEIVKAHPELTLDRLMEAERNSKRQDVA
jgi:hypothetical protein